MTSHFLNRSLTNKKPVSHFKLAGFYMKILSSKLRMELS